MGPNDNLGGGSAGDSDHYSHHIDLYFLFKIKHSKPVLWSLFKMDRWILTLRHELVPFVITITPYSRISKSCIGFSEEEAKKKIYLVSCGWTYGFGVQLNNAACEKLKS